MKKYLKNSLVCLGLALSLAPIVAMDVDQVLSSQGSSRSSGGSQGRLCSQPGVPHKGWTDEGVEDLKALVGVCEWCGTSFRHEHTMSHEDYRSIKVGFSCAEKLSEDYTNKETGHISRPDRLERDVVNARSRAERAEQRRLEKEAEEERQRVAAAQRRIQREVEQAANAERRRVEQERRQEQQWVGSFRQNDKGNYYKSLGHDDFLNIFQKGGQWKYVRNNQFSGPFPSAQDAMRGAYQQYRSQ